MLLRNTYVFICWQIINKGNIVADEKLDDLLTGQFQTIQIEFDKKVDEEIIKKLPYLKQISNLEGNVWSLGFETEEDMRAKVFDFTVHNGLRALQLNQRVTSLEALFQNLTN